MVANKIMIVAREKIAIAWRYRFYDELERAPPPPPPPPLSFSPFAALQSFLREAQQQRRAMLKVSRAGDSSVRCSTAAAACSADGARGGRLSREKLQRHWRNNKKGQDGVLPEMRELQLRSVAPQIAPPAAWSSFFCSSPSSANSSSSSSSSSDPSSTFRNTSAAVLCSALTRRSSSTTPPPPLPAAARQSSALSDARAALVLHVAPASPDTESSESESAAVAAAAGATIGAGPKKKYPCEVCDKSFDYKHVLQNHNRTHTGEKPYQCAQCHKRFTRDHHLKTHVRLHTGEKPFGCAVCCKRFVQVANLRRHERVHAAGERSYRCGDCRCHADCADATEQRTQEAGSGGGADDAAFGCAACGARFRRKRRRNGDRCVRSVSLAADAPATRTPLSADVRSMSASPDVSPDVDFDDSDVERADERRMDGRRRFDEPHGAQPDAHAAIAPSPVDADAKDGGLRTDVGMRIADDRPDHPLDRRRYEGWLRFHRPLQQPPCQEQPEDLSIKN